MFDRIRDTLGSLVGPTDTQSITAQDYVDRATDDAYLLGTCQIPLFLMDNIILACGHRLLYYGLSFGLRLFTGLKKAVAPLLALQYQLMLPNKHDCLAAADLLKIMIYVMDGGVLYPVIWLLLYTC